MSKLLKRILCVFSMCLLACFIFINPAISENGVVKTPLTQGPLQQINKYFSTQTITYSDGTSLSRDIINGPPKPPSGYELERAAVALPEPNQSTAASSLTVPAFNWVFGCSSVSGAMIAGYYDRNGYPNMYTGPTNSGVMPLDNSSWGTWSDGFATYPNLPLAASHNGVDGRATKGSIDDYWIQNTSSASDPYITGPWTQHTWSDAIGDYMKTSQSAYGNTDGSTTFWNYTSSASPLTCADMLSGGVSTTDGTYGRKLFYEARGYTVTDCYSQKTDNTVSGGFSFAQLKAEIDAGRPVMLSLAGHTIVAVGYNDSTNLVYVHDTWDYLTHSVTWGSDYSGYQLLSASIVNLADPPVYANFTGYGLYKWNGTAWSKINTVVADSMTASSTDLYATFTGYPGLYKWNGTAWSKINTVTPINMAGSGLDLYASFTGYGVYKWNGTAWSRINTVIAAGMEASSSDLYASFTGYGLYKWNGTVWSRIHTLLPDSMTASSTGLYATFTGYTGPYKWNGTAWTKINTVTPDNMAGSGPGLYASFTGYGTYKWNGAAWVRINTVVAAAMTGAR